MHLEPPSKTSPTIAIVGSGAIGGYYGARLAQHGHKVHFLLRSDFRTVTQTGWTVRSASGDFHLPPDRFHAHTDVRQIPPVDLVVLTLKSTSAGQYESVIGPLLGPDTAILTLQNGLGNEEILARQFGPRRIIGGLAWICSTRTAAGVTTKYHHGPGLIHGYFGLGEASEIARGEAQRARADFKAMLERGV